MSRKNNLKKDIQLLKRRMKYFISKNGGTFDIEKWGSPTDRKSYNAANRALKSARKSYELSNKINKVINESKQLGIKLHKDSNKLKTEKDYKIAKNKISYKKQKAGVRVKQDIKQLSEQFMDELQKYNQTIVRKDMHKRLNLRPRNVEELIKFRKILEAAKAGRYDIAKKLLGGSAQDNMHRASINQDSFRAAKAKDYTYQDYIYLKTAIREAESSFIPELADLLRAGKESLAKELAKGQFTVLDYAYQFELERGDQWEGREYILAGLEHILPKMSAVNKRLVKSFLIKMRK